MHSVSTFALLLLLFTSLLTIANVQAQHQHESEIKSPYAGQEVSSIKALSDSDIDGLLNGSGTPFGGMAKTAELNGYPGPRHVLYAYEGGEFELSEEQYSIIFSLFEEMKEQAIDLGTSIISVERDLETAFQEKTIDQTVLEELVAKSAQKYGVLRTLHLSYHLQMIRVLTPEQIQNYNVLRGYSSELDPCENVPEGHNPEMWKLHNNCGE